MTITASPDKITFRMLEAYSPQQDQLLPLLSKCFPEAWGRMPAGSPFPYAGVSAVAEYEGRFVGHAAIQRIMIECGDGSTVYIAGLASVGVDPEFRRRGIAANLCRMHFDAASRQNFAFMALYTDKGMVYSSVGWQHYQNPDPVWRINFISAPPASSHKDFFTAAADQVSSQQQQEIKTIYQNGVCFPGKCRRYEGDKVKHSWATYFAHKTRQIILIPGGYAMVAANGILEEFYAPPGNRKQLLDILAVNYPAGLTVAVPECCLAPAEAAEYGFNISYEGTADPMEGEYIMLRTFDNGTFPDALNAINDRRLYLPAADKF